MQTRIKETYPIDIVVPWVDAGDPQWQAQRNKAAGITEAPTEDNADARFRDWDIIRYLFRGIQKHAPWVRTVHFITVGHLPKWMNTEAPGLRIVKHTDYIPEIYLPTFSSHTIELNMHRIPGLAEHFIYFNDDILIQKDLVRTNFFLRGLPRDTAVHTAMTSTHRFSVKDTALLSIISVNEITRQTQNYVARTYNTIPAYTMCAVFYLVLLSALMILQHVVEQRLKK